MSFHYPRRVKDLPTLETDSEDDFNTPQKTERSSTSNKENVSMKNQFGSATTSHTNSAFTNLRIPKRSSELPTLESDSEEEDNIRSDNLNCAILNDSFILSPGRSEQDESSISQSSSAVKAKDGSSNGNLSFLTYFDKMALNCDKETMDSTKKQPLKMEEQFVRTQKTNQKLGCPLQSIQENKMSASSSSAIVHRTNSGPTSQQQQQQLLKANDLETPFKSTNTAGTCSTAVPGEGQFVTPQIHAFPSHQRSRNLCSSQFQRQRTAPANEFRSQKVLFQTPMAVTSRPRLSCMSNDSLTLSLCDTTGVVAPIPITSEKSLPQPVESTAKSNKSLESDFKEIEYKSKQENDAALDQKAFNAANAITAVAGSGTSAASSNENIIQINNADYAISRKLGSGGSSTVYAARRLNNGKDVALKVVDLRGDHAVVMGYLNETKLLAKLQGSICVVSLYDYQLLQKESKLYMVMEKGDSDLHKILQSYTTNLPLYLLMNLLYQMFHAVNYIHQNGVIHSDLKPANFLMVNGRLKLIDFGIASNISLDSTSIIKFSQAGTFNYISPEALTDISSESSPKRNNQPKIKISTKSDVWSLGCILYLLLYQETPFNHIKNIYAKINAICNPTHIIAYPSIPQYYPIMLVHMVKNCLQHNPKQRPSCAELLQYPFNMVIPIQNLALTTTKPT